MPVDAADWHLAQVNVGRLIAPAGDPCVTPFFAALDRINALADAPSRLCQPDPWCVGSA